MKFFQKMERRFGRYAIRNLMYYIMLLYAAGLVLQIVMPGIYWNWLSLNARAILHGQIWRIVTFLIYPPVSMSSVGAAPVQRHCPVSVLFPGNHAGAYLGSV